MIADKVGELALCLAQFNPATAPSAIASAADILVTCGKMNGSGKLQPENRGYAQHHSRVDERKKVINNTAR